MRLLSLDHVVWQDILLNWLGNLCQVIRLDFAIGVTDTDNNKFREVFAELAFSLSGTTRMSKELLAGVFSWMKIRKVYLNRVEVRKYLSEWEEIFVSSKNHLTQLHISASESISDSESEEDTTQLLNITSIYCRSLQKLKLEYGLSLNCEMLRTVLFNNASTLVVLILEGMLAPDTPMCLDEICCQHLRVLDWDLGDFTGLGAFLRRCPNLYAISLSSDNAPESLFSALAESCLRLRRLRLYGFQGIDSSNLRRIARGCALLEYLRVVGVEEALPAGIVSEFFTSLSHLHTFTSGNKIAESTLLAMAARKCPPSLRVLDTYTEFTCTGFLQFTAAYPHLTGLNVTLLRIDANRANKHAIFEHCRNLTHLKLGMDGEPREVVDAVLESVALCCPNLEVFGLCHLTRPSTLALQKFFDKCTNLKYVTHHNSLAAINIPPGVSVSFEYISFNEWMPDDLDLYH